MNGNKLEVLIVEDNPADAFMVKEMLRDLKLELNITLAKDGREALDLLMDGLANAPDMVILDLNLPKVDGFEVLKLMKADNKRRAIPVIVMTGSLKKEDEKRARELGAIDYCMKPATAEEMERSEMCLRAQLEPLSNARRSSGSASSVDMALNSYHVKRGEWYAVTPYEHLFIMDVLDDGSWRPWK